MQGVSSRQVWTGQLRIDSREVRPGDIFAALPGSRQDGHDFAVQALAQGAALAMLQADRSAAIAGPKLIVQDTTRALTDWARWHRAQSDALIIGVTGSVGKTTTRELIHLALTGAHAGTRSRKNYNNDLGVPLSLLDIGPDHEFAVLELGAARRGEIARLAALAQPEVGVVTAVGSAHLETFGSLAGVMQGKGELLEALPPGGFAVLPGDSPHLRALAQRAACPVIFVGEQSENDLRASAVTITDRGLGFLLDGQQYHIPVFGRHHLTNVLCAVAIGRELGITGAVLAESLAEFQPVVGRSQVRRIGSWTVIDDTYNASPMAFSAAVQALSEMPTSSTARRIIVAGDMLELGTAAPAEHRLLGESIGQGRADRLFVTGQFADDVARGAISAGMSPHGIAVAQDWDTLLLLLECWLEPEDVLLVKGSRGMRMERIIDWLTVEAETHPQFVYSAPVRKSA